MDTKPFRFLALPVELRLMVYERLPRQIKHRELYHVEGQSTYPCPPTDQPVATVLLVTKAIPAAILRVSRTVHDEALPVVGKILDEFFSGWVPRLIISLLDAGPGSLVAVLTVIIRALRSNDNTPRLFAQGITGGTPGLSAQGIYGGVLRVPYVLFAFWNHSVNRVEHDIRWVLGRLSFWNIPIGNTNFGTGTNRIEYNFVGCVSKEMTRGQPLVDDVPVTLWGDRPNLALHQAMTAETWAEEWLE